MVDPKRQKIIIPAVDISHTDWPNGQIHIEFHESTTIILNEYDNDEILLAIRPTVDSKPKTIIETVKAIKMPLSV